MTQENGHWSWLSYGLIVIAFTHTLTHVFGDCAYTLPRVRLNKPGPGTHSKHSESLLDLAQHPDRPINRQDWGKEEDPLNFLVT